MKMGKSDLLLFPADEDGNILDTKRMKSLGAAAAKNGGGLDDDPADNESDMCPPFCPWGIRLIKPWKYLTTWFLELE